MNVKLFGPIFDNPDLVRRVIRGAVLDVSVYGEQVLKSVTPVDTGHLRDGVLYQASRNPARYNPAAVKRNTVVKDRAGQGWQTKTDNSGFRVYWENRANYGVFVFGRLKDKGDDRLKQATSEIRDEFNYQLEVRIVKELN